METAGIRAATWVVGKALGPLAGGVLEAWGASSMLGSNMKALKMQLLYAQAMLNNVRDREIHNPALGELLDNLRQLAYRAEDVLDELDYFRIQDEVDHTYDAADTHAAGCVQDLVLNARHTARACLNKLKLPACSGAATRDPDEQQDGVNQGCFSRICSCGRCEIRSLPPSPTNQVGQEVDRGCMPKVASSARDAAHSIGKHFPCYSFPSVHNDDPDTGMLESSNMPENGQRFLCGAWLSSKAPKSNHAAQSLKLKFDRVEMSTKLRDVVEELKPVCAMVSTILNLELLRSSRTLGQEIAMNKAQTTSEITEPKLYGRDCQKKIILDEIVNSECRDLTVLPIVGPGGIGKTTFTQHIYEQMKKHFDVPIWICVSFDFNANRLAKDIVKKIPKVDNENNCSDEELISQRIKGKRVLLVLDDVWTHHENEWKKLLALFKKEGANGNMVIVTTRIPEVADIVKTTKCLELERLSRDDIMSFFQECIFGNQKTWVGHPGLAEVGSKIVDKLKGFPLAAKTVGRLLRNKLTSNHWISVLASKEWESQTDENDIMPALKLSYDHLPFHLQQCFSFCGLFPQDYEFGSKELVHLWIGLDILHSYDQTRKRIEEVGLGYLNDLVNHGFFKMIKREGEHPYYVIHDLLQELAVKVSSYECLSIYSSNVRYIQISPSVHHLSIIIDKTDVEDKMSFDEYNGNLNALDKRLNVEHLRTLMLFGDYHGSFAKTFCRLFKEATALRVIFLSGASYNLDDILHNFSKLVHLRYLRIKSLAYWGLCLPSALFRLYHLEVLDLHSVCRFIGSTRDMSNLVKLHHFIVPKNMFRLHYDIFRIGKLKMFQDLKEFRVGKDSEGFELSQLGQLTEIGGSLGIYNLENVQTKEEANELKLINKNHVRELVLEWDVKRSNTDHVLEENVLGSLVPHSGLQELCIRGHGGTNGPSWLCTNLTVKFLESLCLDGVSWKNLPPLGEMWMVNERGEEYQGCSISPPSFHNLKRLQLINISCLKRWVGNGACPLFSHLEVLIVRDCFELIELPFSNPTCYEGEGEEKMAWFPRLRELVIKNCPILASVPPIPWRRGAPCSAEILRVGSDFKRLDYSKYYGSTLMLKIEGNDGHGDVLWNGLKFSNLTDVEELHVTNIPPLPLDKLKLLASLKRIMIYNSSSVLPPVQSAGPGTYRFPVEDLVIIDCDTSGEELTLLLSFLPNLSKLDITLCENITGLGVAAYVKTVSGEQQQQQQQTRGEEEIITAAAAKGLLLLPPHLQELYIRFCKKITLLSNPPHDDQAETTAAEGTGGGLQRLLSLRYLHVKNCPEFLSSYSSPTPSSSFSPFPICLQDLTLEGVKHMGTLQALSNLTSLTKLSLLYLEGSRDEGLLWPLLAHGRLTKLTLYSIPDFFAAFDPSRPHDTEVFSRSSKLMDLSTSINTGFLAAPICSLLSSTLTRLDLSFDDEVERLTKEQEEALQLLTSLQDLRFQGGHKLQRLPAGLHRLINLKKLEIQWCKAIRSLPSLPTSLQELEIYRCTAFTSLPNSLPSSLEVLKISQCKAIKSLPNSLPSSLEILTITNCKAIKSLPKDGLPSSMRELDVHDGNSEELKRACRKLIGTIPIIKA